MFASQLMYLLSCWLCVEANINFSVIIVIYGFIPFFTAFMFYFIFGETVKPFHIIGMCLMVVCVGLIFLSDYLSDSDDDDGEYISVAYPICVTILSSVFYSC